MTLYQILSAEKTLKTFDSFQSALSGMKGVFSIRYFIDRLPSNRGQKVNIMGIAIQWIFFRKQIIDVNFFSNLG